MTRKILYMLSLLLLVSTQAGMAQVAVPDTPAGHTLQAWLDAFNSGDRAKIEISVKNWTIHRPSTEWSHSATERDLRKLSASDK